MINDLNILSMTGMRSGRGLFDASLVKQSDMNVMMRNLTLPFPLGPVGS